MAIDRGNGIVTPAVLADSYDLDGILAKYEEFDDLYLGKSSVEPTTDNDGDPLQTGALYFSTVSNGLFVYNGTSWDEIGAIPKKTYYVDPTGDDANSGESLQAPFLTIQKAFDTIEAYDQHLLVGTWEVVLSAGTYTEGGILKGALSNNRIEIKGPPRDSTVQEVPTAIIDGTTASNTNGLYFNTNMYVSVTDIKIINFTSSTLSCGVLADHGSDLYTKNVHVDNVTWCGLNASARTTIRVESGIINNARYGVRAYSSSVFTIGYNSNASTNRPQITNSTEDAIHIMSSQGHIDYVDIDNDTATSTPQNRGIYIYNQGRAHILGTVIENCNEGINCSVNSTFATSVANTYTNNTTNTIFEGYSLPYSSQDLVRYDEVNDRWTFGYGLSSAAYSSNARYVFEADASILSPTSYFVGGTGTRPRITLGTSDNPENISLEAFSSDVARILVNNNPFFSLTDSTLRFLPATDNTHKFGFGSMRWETIYAGTGTINTSDANEKQQIEELSATEKKVATALKGLIRKFKFNDAVESKGDKARIHVGVIAQDVKSAFEAEQLNADDYGMFCLDTWYEDADGNVFDSPADDLVEKTRLGVRYDELLAFIISAL